MPLDFIGETTNGRGSMQEKRLQVYDIKYGNDVFGSDHTMFGLMLLLSAGEA